MSEYICMLMKTPKTDKHNQIFNLYPMHSFKAARIPANKYYFTVVITRPKLVSNRYLLLCSIIIIIYTYCKFHYANIAYF